jgi:hypothetical protein
MYIQNVIIYRQRQGLFAPPTAVVRLRSQLQNANVQNHEVIFHCLLAVTPIASPNQSSRNSKPLVGQTGVKTLINRIDIFIMDIIIVIFE